MSSPKPHRHLAAATGTSRDLDLADAWIRGVLDSILGPEKGPEVYLTIEAQSVLRFWVSLTPAEA